MLNVSLPYLLGENSLYAPEVSRYDTVSYPKKLFFLVNLSVVV